MYVFRNYTIENLFNQDYSFSGYGDISVIPSADGYIWFYNVPINPDLSQLMEEIKGIGSKLELVSARIPETAPFYIFTLEPVFLVTINESDHAIRNAIEEVNKTIRDIGERYSNVRVVDFGNFLGEFKPSDRINWKFYFLSQMIISPTLIPAFKEWWEETLRILNNPRKKCLVLDLDNTLWGGVLGEDGLTGVKMSGDYPGNAFMYFQEGLIELARNGVIITVCSKNNEADVKELWEKNPFIKLGPAYITTYRINWQNKADNIRELAAELNIGLDSMVFIDDNPTERELVRQQLPMVEVPEFPKRPYDLMAFYKNLVERYFRTYRLTTEDLNKTAQYKANAQRANEQAHFTDLKEFIRSLEIQIKISTANEFNIPRLAQMTQKTNQFNLTTHRYTEADINNFIREGAYIYCISVSDKFGDNGITGEIIITKENATADIDTLLLSCRILGKDIEVAFVNTIINELYKEGIRRITATYIPTVKNGLVSEFYDRLGFTLAGENEGIKKYKMDIKGAIDIEDLYNITID